MPAARAQPVASFRAHLLVTDLAVDQIKLLRIGGRGACIERLLGSALHPRRSVTS